MPAAVPLIAIAALAAGGAHPPFEANEDEPAAFEKVRDRWVAMDAEDRAVLVDAWADSQDALISVSELQSLFVSRRSALEQLHVRSSYEYSGATLKAKETEFWLNGAEVRLDWSSTAAAGGKQHWRRAYDGRVQWVLSKPSTNWSANRKVFSGWSYFYEMEGPLAAAMLIDSNRAYGVELRLVDGEAWLAPNRAIVEGGVHDVNGMPCITVSAGFPARSRLALALDYDLSPVLIEQYEFEADDRGRLARRITYRRASGDFVDCGNSIWIPRRVTMEWFRDRSSEPTQILVCTSDVIMHSQFPNIFDELIPSGTLVSDSIRGVTYRAEEGASIEKTLEWIIGEVTSDTQTQVVVTRNPTTINPTTLDIQLEGDDITKICGPVSCFVAQRLLGSTLSFGDALGGLHWRDEGASLNDMVSFLTDSAGLDVELASIESSELIRQVTRGQVCIVVQQDQDTQARHSTVVVTYLPESDQFVVVDYPDLRTRVPRSVLERDWTGIALIVAQPGRAHLRTVLIVIVLLLVISCTIAITRRSFYSPQQH